MIGTLKAIALDIQISKMNAFSVRRCRQSELYGCLENPAYQEI